MDFLQHRHPGWFSRPRTGAGSAGRARAQTDKEIKVSSQLHAFRRTTNEFSAEIILQRAGLFSTTPTLKNENFDRIRKPKSVASCWRSDSENSVRPLHCAHAHVQSDRYNLQSGTPSAARLVVFSGEHCADPVASEARDGRRACPRFTKSKISIFTKPIFLARTMRKNREKRKVVSTSEKINPRTPGPP